MTIRKSNPYLSLVNSYLIDSPQPSSINYWWNVGSLLGLCLVIQIASGIFLAMHYSSSIELAFNSVEHIMRDVNAGWLIRYIHANGCAHRSGRFTTCWDELWKWGYLPRRSRRRRGAATTQAASVNQRAAAGWGFPQCRHSD